MRPNFSREAVINRTLYISKSRGTLGEFSSKMTLADRQTHTLVLRPLQKSSSPLLGSLLASREPQTLGYGAKLVERTPLSLSPHNAPLNGWVISAAAARPSFLLLSSSSSSCRQLLCAYSHTLTHLPLLGCRGASLVWPSGSAGSGQRRRRPADRWRTCCDL